MKKGHSYCFQCIVFLITVGMIVGFSLCQMFISLDHEKSNYGVGSPGPATAAPPSGIGRPQLSTNKSMPAWGFGTARGSARHDTNTPGPGEYFA